MTLRANDARSFTADLAAKLRGQPGEREFHRRWDSGDRSPSTGWFLLQAATVDGKRGRRSSASPRRSVISRSWLYLSESIRAREGEGARYHGGDDDNSTNFRWHCNCWPDK